MRPKSAWILLSLAGALLPTTAFAKVVVTLYNGATPVGSSQSFSDGTNITVSDAGFGLTTLQAQNVNRVVIAGTTGAYTGAITVSLSASGTTATSVEISTIGNCAGLVSSAPSSRPIVLTLSSTGNLTGDVSVNSVSALQVGGSLDSNFTVAANSGSSLRFGSIGASGKLNVVSGSIGTLTIDASSTGDVLVQNGSITTIRAGTSTTAGSIGGTVIVTAPSTSGGVIGTITSDAAGPAPAIGNSVTTGTPAGISTIWAKNGIGRITGGKIWADIRASGGFTYTPPGGSSTSVAYTDSALMKLESTSTSDWLKGSISAARFAYVSSSEPGGMKVGGVCEAALKIGFIGYVSNDQPIVIEVGSVPTDPSGGVWLDLTDASLAAPLGAANRGVITGRSVAGSVTTRIEATSGRLGSIKARAIVPEQPSSPFSTQFVSTPHFISSGAMGRITTERQSGDTSSTYIGSGWFNAGDCVAVVQAGGALEGIDTDGRLDGDIDALSIGDSTIRGGIRGSLTAGPIGGVLTDIDLSQGVAAGKVFRTKYFDEVDPSTNQEQFDIGSSSPGLIIYNVDNSLTSGQQFGWLEPLVVVSTTIEGRPTSGSSGEFGASHIATQFGYSGNNYASIPGHTAGAAPFAVMRLDSFPTGADGVPPPVNLFSFLNGVKPIRIRYNGPVELPETGVPFLIEEQTGATSWTTATTKFTATLGGSAPTREIVLTAVDCDVFNASNRFRVRYTTTASDRPVCDKLLTSSPVSVFEREDYGTAAATGTATPIQFTFSIVGCNRADVGIQGGYFGADCTLDNNDYISFINLFFAHDFRADLGIAGGLEGSDGAFDNNDFIAFISIFFSGCDPECGVTRPDCYGPGAGLGFVGLDEGEGEGENLMGGAPDPYAGLRASLQDQINALPEGSQRDELVDWLNSLPPPPSGGDDH